MIMEFEYIQHEKKLRSFCKDTAKQVWLVLDTEFIREKTYYPNLCLIQIATDEKIVCIDTLKIDDLTPLKDLLFSPTIIKVFHAASQDLEILFNLFDDIPIPIFDTQIAASALGYGEQVSYAHLVKEICNVILDKSLSRAAWNRRPLKDEEIQYAIDDVKYLAQIYQHLTKELETKNRTHWVTDECQRICAIENYQINENELWKSINGVGKLEPSQLITLKHLASWRDHQARKENKPRQWILRNKSLRNLAIEQPKDIFALSNIEEITKQQLNLYSDSLLHCIENARQIPEHLWPNKNQQKPLDREQRKLLKHALQMVRERAEELQMSPNLLATRSKVEKLIRGERELLILRDWRQELIGNDLLQLVENSNAI